MRVRTFPPDVSDMMLDAGLEPVAAFGEWGGKWHPLTWAKVGRLRAVGYEITEATPEQVIELKNQIADYWGQRDQTEAPKI